MSKTLFIVSAFLIAFISLTPTAFAQSDDFDGFAPAPDTTPAPSTQPTTPTINVAPTSQQVPVTDDTTSGNLVVSPRDQQLNNLRNNEVNAFQSA